MQKDEILIGKHHKLVQVTMESGQFPLADELAQVSQFMLAGQSLIVLHKVVP